MVHTIKQNQDKPALSDEAREGRRELGAGREGGERAEVARGRAAWCTRSSTTRTSGHCRMR